MNALQDKEVSTNLNSQGHKKIKVRKGKNLHLKNHSLTQNIVETPYQYNSTNIIKTISQRTLFLTVFWN